MLDSTARQLISATCLTLACLGTATFAHAAGYSGQYGPGDPGLSSPAPATASSVAQSAITGAVGPALSPSPDAAAAGGAAGSSSHADESVPVAVDEITEQSRKQLDAGIRYESGDGVPRDLARARGLYCEAAKTDNSDALVRLGWLYANGSGVPRNEAVASALFQRAARLGNETAAQLLQLFNSGSALPGCLTGGADPQVADTIEPARRDTQSAALTALAANAAGASAPTPVVAAPAPFRTAPAAPERKKVVELVLQLARSLKLDPRLVLALISTESGFDPTARSGANAQGLMQLIPDTAERFAVKDVYDPLENLRGGMSYLRWLLAYYRGDVVLAIAAYNAGEGAVDKYKGVPPFAETLAYVQRIRAFYPYDFHPFDATAASASSIIKVGNDVAAPTVTFRPRS